MIYFIECAGRVKIGFSVNPKIRMNKISADAPFPCTLLGVIPGDQKTEKTIHEQWHLLHCHREWFSASKVLLNWIETNSREPKSIAKVKTKFALAAFSIKHGLKTIIAPECGVMNGMTSTPAEKLLAEVNDFLAETGMGVSYFGKVASGNSELVKRLNMGRRVWPETAEKIRSFMSNYRQRASVKHEAAE